MFKIYPYKMGSASVKKLKEALDADVIKLEGSKYKYKDTDIVINWGNSREHERLSNAVIFNSPDAVALAANKLRAFEALTNNDIPTVPFTTDRDVVREWLGQGKKVFSRATLTGHSGEGIEVITAPVGAPELSPFEQDVSDIIDELAESAETESETTIISELNNTFNILIVRTPRVASVELPTAPLYTKAITNNGEYRVHVFDGEVILYQKKSRRVDEDGNVIIRKNEDKNE